MKIQKGDAGYLRRRKRLLILEAVVSFGLVAALVIAGYVTTKTKLNLLTVVAVLGCLPAIFASCSVTPSVASITTRTTSARSTAVTVRMIL